MSLLLSAPVSPCICCRAGACVLGWPQAGHFSKVSFLPTGIMITKVMTMMVMMLDVGDGVRIDISWELTETSVHVEKHHLLWDFRVYWLVDAHLRLAQEVDFPVRLGSVSESRCLASWFGPTAGCFLLSQPVGPRQTSPPHRPATLSPKTSASLNSIYERFLLNLDASLLLSNSSHD